jgi:hypothetical protein
MKIIAYILTGLCIGLSSCSNADKKIPDDYIKIFIENKKTANDVVDDLKADTFLNGNFGTLIKSDQFSKNIQQKLHQIGITDVHTFSWGGKQRQFDFITNWNDKNPIHIIRNNKDTTETKIGFYRKDENFNEFCGLGENWTIWIERKLIENKDQ